MKKIVACLLSACLCIQGVFGAGIAYAAEVQPIKPAEITVQEAATSSDAVKEEDRKETYNHVVGEGTVSVELKTVMTMKGKTDFDIFLVSSEGNTVSDGNISIGEASGSSKWFSDEVPVGKYTLIVKGEGYETYEQEIKVEESLANVVLMNGYIEGYTYSKGEKHPGVLRMGDVNGDGKLETEDMNIILDDIESEAVTGSDLNGDGEVDLLDIQYFSTYYKDSKDNKAGIVRNALITQVVASSSNAEPLKGTVEGVFANDSVPLTIKSENDLVISESNPIEVSAEVDSKTKVEGISIISPVGSEYTIDKGEATVEYIDQDGTVRTMTFRIDSQNTTRRRRSARSAFLKAERNADGTIVLNLGSQVAVKKVSIKVTAANGSSGKLVDISKVEFLNDMKDRIPEPNMNIPTNLSANEKSEAFTLTWKKQSNVTGYQIKIWKGTKDTEDSVKTEYIETSKNQISIGRFDNNDLINGEVYTVRVQSLNGEWRSGYSASLEVIPKTMERPAPPEGISITGKYRSLAVSWKAMKDTDSYTIFYRPTADNKSEFKSIGDIRKNNTTIPDLQDETEYTIYLKGHNVIGESSQSKSYKGTTMSPNPPTTTNYKLINVPVEGGESTAHIKDVNYFSYPANSKFAITDNDYITSWVRPDWDSGVHYPQDNRGKAPVVEFDQVYELENVIMIPDVMQPYEFNTASFYYWEEASDKPIKVDGTFSKKTSTNGKTYYEFETVRPVRAKKVQLNVASWGANNRISYAEMKYYHYDSLEDDINALFADDMHLSLKGSVTQNTIDELSTRLTTKDPVSDEYHPKKSMLERELGTAQKILIDGALNEVLPIDTYVTKRADNRISFRGGLNSWQPLGVTAMAGDEIVVYVGSPGKKTGSSTNIKLISTQYHGEFSAWFQAGANLKVGPNTITIPKISSEDVEQGGQLYIEYVGDQSAEKYSVRVSGGIKIPMLDITKATDSNAKKKLVKKYVEELERYVPEIEAKHQQEHGHKPFDKKTCILGATDIVTTYTMYSVSSDRILAGLKGSTQEKTEQLYQSLTAMDEMVDLFYQHKGFNKKPLKDSDKLPVSRLNLRYQSMFDGAFMYAGGLHIGIEWDSVTGLAQGTPMVTNDQGKYVSGQYFGWGIAHEIGHIINEGAYAIAEVTNNYFSVLAQAKDTNASVRLSYDNVYEKVTSGVKGKSADVFTQLGLYWQLHLAYDRGGYNYKTFEAHRDQLDNLFFARVDSYVRNPASAPKPNGIALTLDNADSDNKLMRLGVAAAEKNILKFFERWGMVPDDLTKQYAAQFTEESRGIWFVNDEARVYAMENPDGSIAEKTTVNAALAHAAGTNEVTLTINSNASNLNAMLGYEIYRSEYVKDQVIRKPVGFITADENSFTDVISAINNRVFVYDVVGYDKYLNATAPFVLDPIKVRHGGFVDKTSWKVKTNMISVEDGRPDNDNPEMDTVPNVAVGKVADGDKATVYTGKSVNNKVVPEIILSLSQEEAITGLVYTLEGGGTPITDFEISVSQDGNKWTKVQQGKFKVKNGALEPSSQTIHFNKPNDNWLYTYEASYVKLAATKQKGVDITVGELDILGESGDNVEFETSGIGILKNDYTAGQGTSGTTITIPKGSLIFTGVYKGNPAFNTVLLYDENNRIVGRINADGDLLASQIIFAQVPAKGELGEVSEGTWVYYVEPEQGGSLGSYTPPAKVRAELYRVDDAETNKGERLVSDSLYVTVPSTLPDIEITASKAYIREQ